MMELVLIVWCLASPVVGMLLGAVIREGERQ